ncbi:hypothetical protein Tco_1382467, partial [Tanacetum coccineum]
DEDSSARPNQGKKTKRSRTKESEPSKKSSTTKESSKGKSLVKTFKSGESVTAEELVEELAFEMASDDIEQTVDDVKHPLKFDELMATLIDFSKFVMNRLKIDKLTKAHLVGPVYKLLKGTCQSSVELEYNMEECYKALSDQLDWNNPEGDRFPFDLTKPLPLKGRLIIPSKYFFNNDLEYLKSSDPEKKYTTSITKTKAARYELVGIEDMIPNLWSITKVGYNKDVEREIKYLGPKHQLWYRSQINKFSKHNVYSTQKILSVVSVTVEKLHGYSYLEEIVVRRVDRQKYTIKEVILLTWRWHYVCSLEVLSSKEGSRMSSLGWKVTSKMLNLTKPQQDFLGISAKELYKPSYDPPGAVYEDLNKQKRLMRADELYKFSDGTLKLVRDELHHRVLNFRLGYNKEMSSRKWLATKKRRSKLMVELIDKQM